jgi:hypothetical protein
MHQLSNRELKWLLGIAALLAVAGILDMVFQMGAR